MEAKKLKLSENVGELVLSFRKLREIQDELAKINEEEDGKILEVIPNLNRKKDIFSQVNDEEIVKLSEVVHKYSEVKRHIYDKREFTTNSVPNFWFSAFISHPALCQLLHGDDHKIFNYLRSIKLEYIRDVRFGFSITFNFSPNPFFEDEKLTKTFIVLDKKDVKVIGTSIKWKEGMGIIPKGVSHDDEKGNKQYDVAHESFFTWFSETQNEGLEKYITGKADCIIAAIIQVDLWAEPLKFMESNNT